MSGRVPPGDYAGTSPHWLRQPADVNALVPVLWSATARKDENGEPISENGMFAIDDQNKARQILADLTAKYPTVLEAIAERNVKINDLLNEDQEITLRKLPLAEWPDMPEDVSPAIMDHVMHLVQED